MIPLARPLALCILLASSLATAGCSMFDNEPSYHVDLRTDQAVYATPSGVTLTVTNHSDRPLSYLCTGPITLQELEGATVVNSWQVHGFEYCGMRDNAIEPGASEAWALDLGREYMHPDGLRPLDARFDDSVQYRFWFELYGESVWDGNIDNPPLVEPLSEANRLSNRFVILGRE